MEICYNTLDIKWHCWPELGVFGDGRLRWRRRPQSVDGSLRAQMSAEELRVFILDAKCFWAQHAKQLEAELPAGVAKPQWVIEFEGYPVTNDYVSCAIEVENCSFDSGLIHENERAHDG